ncbi:MAG: protein translocase subunit SecF [Candidatus Shapirobacteria bacterium]|nr:protein translocase subunit SecF [Candidatus Shapirobacteria bacterium]
MNIMKFRPLFLIISSLLLISSLLSIVFWGFKPSIDFVGGAVWELNLPSAPENSKITEIFTKNNIDKLVITKNNTKYHLEFKDITSDQKNILNDEIKKIDQNYQELKFETLGATLGKELLRKTVMAIVLSSLFLLLFIGRRFKDFSFGAGAIIAMLHDTFILIGSFSILGHFFGAELDSLFVTALLTTLSSSVHDTVVTFNRIRELKLKNLTLDWVNLANQAVTETLSRSINNSMTIVFMLLSLVVLGRSTTKWFATALLIGVVCGTYSSTGVAIPLVLFFKRNKKKK